MPQEWIDLAPAWLWRSLSTLGIVAAAWLSGRVVSSLLTARVMPGGSLM